MSHVVDTPECSCAALPDLGEMPLGELARSHPQALGLLRSLRLDYCCGGARSLREAAAERGLDLQQLQRDIAALQPQASELPQQPAQLVDHILQRFHATHRAELPELVRLAHKVERVHAGHAQVPRGLEELLQRCLDELSQHMDKEEQILFPMMQRVAPGTNLQPPVARMRAEHNDHAQLLVELRRATDDFRPPAEACNSWRALYAGVAKFCDDLVQHIHLENNLLFPAFEPARGA